MSRESDEVIAALIALCKEKEVACVGQIGAEDGAEVTAIMESLKIPGFAVEADSRCQSCCAELPYFYAAIGADNTLVTFYEHPVLGLSGIFPRGEQGERAKEIVQLKLDSFIDLLGMRPDALIIDTEGSTLEVLEGAVQLLPQVKLLYAECQLDSSRPGIRQLDEVENFLRIYAPHLTRRDGLPAYDGGSQGNFVWVEP